MTISKGRTMKTIVLIMLLLASGCATMEQQGGPTRCEVQSRMDNNVFEVSISAADLTSYNGGYKAIELDIRNKTNDNLQVDWNKTYYFRDGQTDGGFMMEGTGYRERNRPRPPDMIPANGTFSKTIWPNNLVLEGSSRGWDHSDLPLGENGIFLTVRTQTGEVSEKISFYLTAACQQK